MKKWTTFLLCFAMCLVLFTACGKDKIPDGPAELWVVTELTDKYGMNDQAQRMIERFNEQYPEVTVKLDILPTEMEERAVYLNKLRTQIMGGAGPDAYLLPTNNYVPDETILTGGNKEVEPLFRDVNLAMDNGAFYDIAKYYDADKALEKDGLNASVMDGGTMNGCRYILPLRYDFGVYLVDRENLDKEGFDIRLIQSGANELMKAALDAGNVNIANQCIPTYSEWYFSDLIDYTNASVTLTADEVAEFMRYYQTTVHQWEKDGTSAMSSTNLYAEYGRFFATDGLSVSGINLCATMDAMVTAKLLGEELEMYPMLATDGTLKAYINYWTAVGAGSENPRLAYEFIRLFLSEEAQYEAYMATGKYRKAWDYAAGGWPVRTVGSVAPRYEVLQYRLNRNNQMQHNFAGMSTAGKREDRQAQFLSEDLNMTDDDVPALTWEVDEARFPVIYEYEDTIMYYLSLLYDPENGYAPSDVDIDTLAQQYIENLRLYLNEG